MASTPPHRREQSQVIPEVGNQKLFSFLEKLWDETECEKIVLSQMAGENGTKALSMLKTQTYKPNLPNNGKPTKEKLVDLANEFMMLAQNHCDSLNKPQRYGVFAWHMRKSDKSTDTFPFSLKPSPEAGETTWDPDDEEGGGGKGVLMKQFSVMAKDHMKHEKLLFSMIGSVFATQNTLIERADDRLVKADENLQKLHDKINTMYDAVQDALDRSAERANDAKWTELQVGAVQQAINLGVGIAPQLFGALTGKQIPGTRPPESFVIENFIKSCSDEQLLVAFGYNKAEQQYTQEGVFTRAQTEIFESVVLNNGEHKIAELFSGENQVTQDQIGRALTIFPTTQIAPLMLLAKQLEGKMGSPQEQPQEEVPQTQPNVSSTQSNAQDNAAPKSDKV